MKSFDEKSSPGSMLKSGGRTIGMAQGLPKTKPLITKFKAAQLALRKAQLANNDADDGFITAIGACDLERELTNEILDELQITLEGVVKRDFKSPLYKAAFPAGLPAFKDLSSQDYEPALVALIDTVKESGEKALKKFVPALQKRVTAFKEPLAARKVAEKKERSASMKLAKAKIAWLDEYAALEGSFNATFPRRKRFVAAFFPQAGGSAKKSAGSIAGPTSGGGPRPVEGGGEPGDPEGK